MNFILLFVSILTILSVCNCLEPLTIISTTAGAGISLGFAGYKYLYCKYNECCDKKWINYDHYGLELDMKNNLFGQHLVNKIVPKSIKAHLEKKEPKKALVLSFHGGTGIGKNHASKMIWKNLYQEGFNSKYVHLYIGTQHFPHSQDVKQYKTFLQKDIEMKVKECERSLFIFDEVDKIPPGVLDILKPYLDYHESVDGTDYRKSIFIFLSNAGAKNISRVALQFWIDGKNREDITLKDMEHLIGIRAFNEKGGLQYSDIVIKDLIDVFVPFLPLEKQHIKQCIQSELKNRNVVAEVDEIVDQLEYVPPRVELFAVTGCKKVDKKIDLYAK